MADADRFVARVSPLRTLVYLLGALGFVAIGIAFLSAPAEIAGRGDPAIILAVGIASIVVFGGFAIVIARQLLRRAPVMEIDAAGILWRRWSDQRIPWDAVQRAEVKTMQRQRFVCLWLCRPELYPSPRLLGRLAGANKAMGFGDIALNVPGTNRSFDDLVDAVRRFGPRLLG